MLSKQRHRIKAASKMAHLAVVLFSILALASGFTNVHAVDTEFELNEMTADTKNLTSIAESITVLDALILAAPVLKGRFTPIIAGLEDITGTGNNASSELDSFSLSFTAGEDFFSDCVQIANGFYNFARAQEQLLNALIDRAGILDDLPEVGSPVYNALGDEKAMIDELAPLIVRACNGTKSLDEQVLADQAALDRLIVTTQSKYDPQGVLDNLNLPLPGNRKLLR